MNQFIQDCEKLQKVVTSCQTREQLKTAYAYYKLWEKKYPYPPPRFVAPRYCYTDGFVLGFIKAKLGV